MLGLLIISVKYIHRTGTGYMAVQGGYMPIQRGYTKLVAVIFTGVLKTLLYL